MLTALSLAVLTIQSDNLALKLDGFAAVSVCRCVHFEEKYRCLQDKSLCESKKYAKIRN